VAVAQADAGVTVELADGTRMDADVAIGADGVRSELRETAFAGAPARFAGHVAWRALVPAERLPEPPPSATCVFMGPGRHLVCYPLRGGALVNVVAVERRDAWTAESWSAAADPDGLRRAFDGWAAPVERLLAAVDATYLWGLFDHPPLPAWASGRVALLGDACHPMTPFLAQGATMALEDAWVLGACLGAARDPVAGLMAYEDRRKPRATRAQRAAARNGRINHLAAPPLRGAAHLGLRAVAAVAPGALMARFDWLYGANVVGMGATD
jgi:salicylate hydroxylase